MICINLSEHHKFSDISYADLYCENIGIYAWRSFYRNMKQNKYLKQPEFENEYQVENIKNKTDNVRK
jgi:hypothetical protein